MRVFDDGRVPMKLAKGQCHLYAASTSEMRVPGLREQLEDLLDPDEQSRCDRFRTDALQSRYTLAHGLLRQVLGQYTATAPRDLRFVRDDRNRPALTPRPAFGFGFDFNLSYTADLVAFAVAGTDRLGCDVERREIGAVRKG